MNRIFLNRVSGHLYSNIRPSMKRLCHMCCNNVNFSTRATNFSLKHSINERRVRNYSDDAHDDSVPSRPKSTGLRGIAGKYKIFQDFDSPIILDVDEERELLRSNPEQLTEVVTKIDSFAEMNLEHGLTGVYDIEDLVQVLRLENARDIVVISVPAERQYVDYMTIVTCKSKKHVWALAEFIRGLYKRKKYEKETIPPIEGEKDSSWLAIDMGNIALHVFTEDARSHYDLETLWSVGYEYDDLARKKDASYIHLLEQYTHPVLSGLKPANAKSKVISKPLSVPENCDFQS